MQPGLPAPPADLSLGLCMRRVIRGSPPRAQEQQSKGRGAGGIWDWCAILFGGSARILLVYLFLPLGERDAHPNPIPPAALGSLTEVWQEEAQVSDGRESTRFVWLPQPENRNKD